MRDPSAFLEFPLSGLKNNTPLNYHSEISLKSIMNNRVRVLGRGLYTITHFFWVPLPNKMVDEFNNPSHNSFSLASSERNLFAYLMK